MSGSSSRTRRDSGGEIYPGCAGELDAGGAYEYGGGCPVYMLLGLRRGVGEAVTPGCLGANPDPSLPRKPMAGKGSLLKTRRVRQH